MLTFRKYDPIKDGPPAYLKGGQERASKGGSSKFPRPMTASPHLDRPNMGLEEAFLLALSKDEARPLLIHPHSAYGYRMATDGCRAHLLPDKTATGTRENCPYCDKEGAYCPEENSQQCSHT